MAETKESFVPKILVDYHQNNRTGILTLKQKSTNKTIHFENGTIVFATTNVEAEQLGTRLLEWGLLTPEQLIATDKLAQENRRFGKSLIELGFFQPEELSELFYRQAIRIIYSTFSWQNFDVRFTRCALPEYEAKNFISVPQTLLEGIRYLDDINLVKTSLGDLTLPLTLSLPLEEIYQQFNLDSQETLLLSALENTTFNIELALKLTHIPEETIIKTLCTLKLLGILKQSKETISIKVPSQVSNSTQKASLEVSQPVHQEQQSQVLANSNLSSPAIDTRIVMQFCYEIETKLRSINSGASLYEVLEVDPRATPEQIKASYQQLCKHFHPNRQQELSISNTDLSSSLNYISTAIEQAYEILINKQTQPKAVQSSNITNNRNTPVNQPIPIANQPSPTSNPSSNKAAPTAASTQPTASTAATVANQQEIMQFCYLIENKLNMIRGEATHYQVLEIERSASREVIDQAYNQLMLQFDIKKQEHLTAYGLNMDSQLEEISKAIRLATEVLRDPQKRQLYDEKAGRALRRNTGQYSTISQSDLKQPASSQNRVDSSKYSSIPSYPQQQSDSRHTLPQSKPTPTSNSIMPALSTDSKIRSQLPNSNPSASSTNHPLAALTNSSAGQRLPGNDLDRSSAGTKIPINPNPTATPSINRPSGNVDLGRSNPGTKPSITIDPTRSALPTFTPLAASKANVSPVPSQAQPAQAPQPAQLNKPLAKNTPVPGSELPASNSQALGNKGKTFSAAEYYLKSIELCDKQKYTEAIESLLMALKLSPKDGEYWAQLARAYSNIEGYEKDTLAAYQKANEYSPKEFSYLLELGDFLRKHGYKQKAAEVYNGVLNLRPQNSKAQLALAELAREASSDESEDTHSRGFWSKWLKQS